jgi:hypothetical protein
MRSAFLFVVSLACTITVLWFLTHVDNSITSQDSKAYSILVKECHLSDSDEILRIKALQSCVLARLPQSIIPHGEPREPLDILNRGHGECYDRARVIEKSLRIMGYSTRHVAMFSVGKWGLLGLLRSGIPSHALLDVKTRTGWMSVGTNSEFLGVVDGGRTVSSNMVAVSQVAHWKFSAPSEFPGGRLITVYGLWSRHGGFFPPYVAMPDIAWSEVFENFKR